MAITKRKRLSPRNKLTTFWGKNAISIPATQAIAGIAASRGTTRWFSVGKSPIDLLATVSQNWQKKMITYVMSILDQGDEHQLFGQNSDEKM